MFYNVSKRLSGVRIQLIDTSGIVVHLGRINDKDVAAAPQRVSSLPNPIKIACDSCLALLYALQCEQTRHDQTCIRTSHVHRNHHESIVEAPYKRKKVP